MTTLTMDCDGSPDEGRASASTSTFGEQCLRRLQNINHL